MTRYLDICSGISAPTAAWKPLGWEAACFAEIEAAPRAVLSHHYPEVPLRGDFTEIEGSEHGPIDLLVGGTPCQSFSVAGLRGGLADDRGNLALQFARLAGRARPRWVVWENVPGVLSIDAGRAFGSILGALAELGYGLAYRVLDAQHFGVPQRRRRVFVVGYLGDWRRAAAVLFERHCLSGHPAPRREAREGITDLAPHGPEIAGVSAGRSTIGRPAAQAFGGGANCHPTDVATAVAAHPGGRYDIDCETFIAAALTGTGVGTCGADDNQAQAGHLIASALMAKDGRGVHSDMQNFVAHSLRGEGFDASEDGTGRGTPLVPVPFDTTQITSAANYSNPRPGDPCHPLAAGAHVPAIAFDCKASGQNGFGIGSIASTSRAMGHAGSHTNGGGHQAAMVGSAVRRLTPRECERLQGFPDDFTLVPHRGKPMADGPRYKMLGNSMAVPVLRWIGERIEMVEAHRAASLEVAA